MNKPTKIGWYQTPTAEFRIIFTRNSIAPMVSLLRPWSGRKPRQGLETPSRLQPHIMLEGRRQPDAANTPPLRLVAVVEVASRLPETLGVAASAVRYTPIASDQDHSNFGWARSRRSVRMIFAQFSNRGHSPYFRYNLSLICPRLYRKFGTYLRFKN